MQFLFYLVYLPSLSSEEVAVGANNDLPIPYVVEQESCLVFEYRIEDLSVFDIEIHSSLVSENSQKIIGLEADSKTCTLVTSRIHA